VIRGQRLEVKASRLPPPGRRTRVTWVVWEIWGGLARGVGAWFGVAVAWTSGGDGWAEATQPNFIWLLKTETLTVEQVKHFHLF